MTIEVDSVGNITLTQGDSGVISFTSIPVDKGYTSAYVGFRNKDTNAIIAETDSNDITGLTDFEIPIYSEVTDLLIVPQGEASTTYYWGLKCTYTDAYGEVCEDTMLFTGQSIGDINIATVYPKEAEGS